MPALHATPYTSARQAVRALLVSSPVCITLYAHPYDTSLQGAVFTWADGSDTNLIKSNPDSLAFLRCDKEQASECCGVVYDVPQDQYPGSPIPVSMGLVSGHATCSPLRWMLSLCAQSCISWVTVYLLMHLIDCLLMLGLGRGPIARISRLQYRTLPAP